MSPFYDRNSTAELKVLNAKAKIPANSDVLLYPFTLPVTNSVDLFYTIGFLKSPDEYRTIYAQTIDTMNYSRYVPLSSKLIVSNKQKIITNNVSLEAYFYITDDDKQNYPLNLSVFDQLNERTNYVCKFDYEEPLILTPSNLVCYDIGTMPENATFVYSSEAMKKVESILSDKNDNPNRLKNIEKYFYSKLNNKSCESDYYYFHFEKETDIELQLLFSIETKTPSITTATLKPGLVELIESIQKYQSLTYLYNLRNQNRILQENNFLAVTQLPIDFKNKITQLINNRRRHMKINQIYAQLYLSIFDKPNN
jgi:hypothetical protein